MGMSKILVSDDLVSFFGSFQTIGCFIEKQKYLHWQINNDHEARHNGHLKKCAAKEYLDEIIPFADLLPLLYPDYLNNPVLVKHCLGNQPWDMEVEINEHVVEKIELTRPHDGATQAIENRTVVENGLVELARRRICDLHVFFEQTARSKSGVDYSDVTHLVFVLDYDAEFEASYSLEKQREEMTILEKIIVDKQYSAQKVWLLVRPFLGHSLKLKLLQCNVVFP